MIEEITPDEAKRMLENDEAILIDVREQEEWNEGRISYASHAPLSRFHELVNDLEIPDGKHIIFQCLAGGRSMKAAQFFEQHIQPDNEIYNMAGGIKVWKALGFEVQA
ncbi:MAG: rhodanese-like domain-containing protein [Bdellovibrionales bacterium]